MCVADVCACDYASRNDCMCKVLSLFARACHVLMKELPKSQQDWSIKNWRNDGLCGQYTTEDCFILGLHVSTNPVLSIFHFLFSSRRKRSTCFTPYV